jgi:exodeoxyribonuclease-3
METMKIVSWNVNGIRAIAKKTFFNDLEQLGSDILCLQETKAQDHQVAETLFPLNDYHICTNSAARPGYSGTAVISKIRPLNVTKGINKEEHDTEGRVLCLEYESFFLVNVYVPNSGSELKRLEYRQDWDKAFFDYLKNLEKTKPVIVCGDLNVAHKQIDLARPKENYNKAAGYMQEEIDGMDRLTGGGLADTFRRLHPDTTERYTWWSYRAGARSKNIGWRIDYFLVSESLLPAVRNAFIMEEITGSDHCPVGINLEL